MKISICDKCNGNNIKVENIVAVPSKYRVGFKGGIKLDLCEKHQDIAIGMTREEFETLAVEILTGKVDTEVKNI